MTTQLKTSQTFRVFFSSPFKGMEDEREELTRKYFPQIRHKCEEIGLQFVAVDMRWGITTEASENGQTINICLREIDRSDMFVSFYGQRYGWHLQRTGGHANGLLQLNIDTALGKYPWIDSYRDRSVTELEILHGHLNNPGAKPACILFRDKQYDDAMRELKKDKALSYTVEDDDAKEKLDDLKQRVAQTKAQCAAIHMDYPNPLEGAHLIFEEIMKYLENNILKQSMEMSKREKDLAPHKAFMASRTSQYTGRKEDFDWLDEKLQQTEKRRLAAQGAADEENEEQPKKDDSSEESPHVLIQGTAGSGKSALICNWLQDRVDKKANVLVIPYFIGCAPSTRDPEELLGFVYSELEHHLGKNKQEDANSDTDASKDSEKDKSETATDAANTNSATDTTDKEGEGKKAKEPERPKGKELQRAIMKQLEETVEKGHTVLLVFDAVNRLVSARKTGKHLYWLPEKLPQGVMCIVSTAETDQATLDILLDQRKYNALKLQPLDSQAQRQICVQCLEQSGKELSENQLATICGAEQTSNPLFLKTVLVELSIFGKFRELDSKIRSLIGVASIKELLHNCLQRLEADYRAEEHHGNLVGDILSAIEVSQEGLTETEIMNIFNIHSHIWSPLCFAIEFFTVSHFGKLGFAISEFSDAVRERYLQKPENRRRIQEKLVTYFDGVRKSLRPWMLSKQLLEPQNVHAMFELVWLQKALNDRAGLITSLSDLSVFVILNDKHELELLELWKWTELRWSDITTLLLQALDQAIAECYLLTQEGTLSSEKSPGARIRYAVSHMRSFFDLAMYFPGVEKALEREIRILENAEGKMDEEKRREFLRDARYYLACNYSSQDRTLEARKAHEANLRAFEKDLEEKDDKEIRKQIAYTHNGLGIVYMNLQEYDKAIEHLTKSGEFHRKNKDKKNEASAYTNLGLVYMYKNEFEKALEFDEKALEAYEEGCFGQLPLEVGNLLTNMALVYRRKKDLDKAEDMYWRSLRAKANAVGWEHPVIATAYMNLGTLMMHRRNYAKAEEFTRKAIAIYEVNEFEKTKKEYRRCRENLFANMLKQNKMEELMPLYIEIFDILNQNGWLDECLASMHRQVVQYMIEKEMYDKAEEVSMALIDSPKVHPQNYAHLFVIDMLKPKEQRPVRPYKYTVEAALDKYPGHGFYNTLCEVKMESQLLPEEDRDGIRTLILRVAGLDSKHTAIDIMTLWLKVADEEKKTDLLFDVLKGLVEEDSSNKQLLRMYLRICVHIGRQADVAPSYMMSMCSDPSDENQNPQGLAGLSSEFVSPDRTKMDVASVLTVRGEREMAWNFLQECLNSQTSEIKKEAQAALDKLDKEMEGDAVTTDQENKQNTDDTDSNDKAEGAADKENDANVTNFTVS